MNRTAVQGINPMMAKGPVSLRFGHGLGDHVHFAHLLAWYGRKGYRFCADVNEDKTPVYRCCDNVEIVRPAEKAPEVRWEHGRSLREVSEENAFLANKVMANLSVAPLPDTGPPSWEFWKELRDTRLDVTGFVTPEESDWLRLMVQTMPRPLVLFHPKGNTLSHSKNLDDVDIHSICLGLAEQIPGTTLVLDWDRRVSIPKHSRIHLMEPLFGKRLTVPELIALLDVADLLIGVDSGPTHLARMVPELPVVHLWQRHHPFAFSFPREGHLHLIPEALRQQAPESMLQDFETADSGHDSLDPQSVVNNILKKLETGSRALSTSRCETASDEDKPGTAPSPPALALYSYHSDNIGDDMQSLVLRRWLGYREDEILFYDRDSHSFNKVPHASSVKLLINGFIGEGALPVPGFVDVDIEPVFLAIHMASVNHDNPGKLEQLRRFAPVGCRDRQALRECEERGIPAYYGGCPTILCQPADLPQDIDVLLIDVDPRKLPALPENRVISYSSNMKISRDIPRHVRREMCLRRWELLSRSRLVVTSKLHAAMPALGMGRPVIFIKEGIVCPGRLSAFPDGFPLRPEHSRFSWDPDDHYFDVSAQRKLVESHLLERIGLYRKSV